MTLADLVDIANGGGMVGILILIVYALWQELVIPRARYRREKREDRQQIEFWRRTAMIALGIAQQDGPMVPSYPPESDSEWEP